MVLQLTEVSKAFGSVIVADAIDLELAPGEALGVIGPNGAGKSSLFNLITGNLKPERGTIALNGADVTRHSPRARCLAGIGRSYQIPQPFTNLTVFENLLVGAAFGQDKSEAEVVDACAAILERTGLIGKANRTAGSLSLLERKRLEMARALATDPKILLLDEIGGGLTEGECRDLVATIKDIHADGTAIIWIEHIVHALVAVVERLIVLNFGKKIAEGDPKDVMGSPQVKEIYLGIAA